MLQLLRSLVRAARRTRDRILHPGRRRRAENLLRERSQVRSILFLCTGNICRSPYAEKVFPALLSPERAPGTQVRSDGFLRAGRPSPEAAVRIAAERGIELNDHRSTTVDARLLSDAELIVVQEARHLRSLREIEAQAAARALLLGDLDPELPAGREIPDPWGHPDEVFRSSFDRMDRCLRALARHLNGPA